MKDNNRERLERAVAHISRKLESIQKIPPVLADRTLKTGALSFLILFFGCYMGRQMGTLQFTLCSVLISAYGLVQAYRMLRTAERKEYEAITGTVYEVKGRHLPGRFYKIRIRMEDGSVTQLLMDKRHKLQSGKRYCFYFSKKQEVLTGVRSIDGALDMGSFYGFEEME